MFGVEAKRGQTDARKSWSNPQPTEDRMAEV